MLINSKWLKNNKYLDGNKNKFIILINYKLIN